MCSLDDPQNPFNKWADAITHHEGGKPGKGGKPADRNVRNCNPGNLKYAKQHGSTGQDKDGFARFPDWQTGRNALIRQLEKYVHDHPNYNLLQIMNHYLGGKDPNHPVKTGQGDPLTYANDVAHSLGEQPQGRTLNEIFSCDCTPPPGNGGDDGGNGGSRRPGGGGGG